MVKLYKCKECGQVCRTIFECTDHYKMKHEGFVVRAILQGFEEKELDWSDDHIRDGMK